MKINKISSIFARVFFAGALMLLLLSVWERIANAMGYTVVGETFAASRLIELAVVLVIFIIALLLRQIREELKHGTHS
jgi:hypothetical protein